VELETFVFGENEDGDIEALGIGFLKNYTGIGISFHLIVCFAPCSQFLNKHNMHIAPPSSLFISLPRFYDDHK
jgi:hypothetical protein